MKWIKIILIICLINLIAGCSMSLANSAWPKAFQNLENTSLSPYSPPFINLMGIAWQYTIQSPSSTFFSSPIIGTDGTVYLGSIIPGDSGLYAFNPDGTLKWKYSVSNHTYTPAIDSNNIIYFGSENGYFYAFNPDGTLKWKYSVENGVVTSPAIDSNNIIYFGGNDNYFYALNPDGTLKWKYELENTDVGGYGGPAIDSNNIIYYAATSGTGPYSVILYAINSDGTLKWKTTIASSAYYMTSPVLDETNKQIYVVVPEAGYLYCYDFDGNQKWTVQISSANTSSGIAFSGQYLYCVDEDKNTIHSLIKVDTNGNKIKTLFLDDGSNESIKSYPILDSNENLYIQYDNKLYITNNNLEIIIQIGLKLHDGYPSTSSAIAEDGTVYVVVDNTLYAIKPFKIQGVLDFSLPGRLIRAQ